jgi:hypothetical protein
MPQIFWQKNRKYTSRKIRFNVRVKSTQKKLVAVRLINNSVEAVFAKNRTIIGQFIKFCGGLFGNEANEKR